MGSWLLILIKDYYYFLFLKFIGKYIPCEMSKKYLASWIGPANNPIVVHCVYKLIYQDFKVFNLLLALWISNKYLQRIISCPYWSSEIFIAGPKSQQKIKDLEIL